MTGLERAGGKYERWLERRARILEEGSAPAYRVATVTRLVETEKPAVEGASEVRVAEVKDRDLLRPGGKRFGALVHEVLARAPLDAAPPDIEAIAESLGRILGNSDEERKAAASAVALALAHPLLERARAAAVVFRETPLVYREPEGRLVEGVPDLVFRDEDSEWTLVDFKTDLRLDIAEALHRAQVALYRLALQEATGRPPPGGSSMFRGRARAVAFGLVAPSPALVQIDDSLEAGGRGVTEVVSREWAARRFPATSRQ